MIFVTNKNDFVHHDRYDGVDYVFAPGESLPIDEAAAAHMFGYGSPDKDSVLVRLGWATKFDADKGRTVADPDGIEKLRKFVFTRAAIVQVDENPEPAPVQTSLVDDDESPI